MVDVRTYNEMRENRMFHIRTSISEMEMVSAARLLLPEVIRKHVERIVAERMPEIESAVIDTMFDRAVRQEMRALVEDAIRKSVKEVIEEMLGTK